MDRLFIGDGSPWTRPQLRRDGRVQERRDSTCLFDYLRESAGEKGQVDKTRAIVIPPSVEGSRAGYSLAYVLFTTHTYPDRSHRSLLYLFTYHLSSFAVDSISNYSITFHRIHGVIDAHDFNGFPPPFHPLRAAVLHVRMTLPPENLPHRRLVNSRIPPHRQP